MKIFNKNLRLKVVEDIGFGVYKMSDDNVYIHTADSDTPVMERKTDNRQFIIKGSKRDDYGNLLEVKLCTL